MITRSPTRVLPDMPGLRHDHGIFSNDDVVRDLHELSIFTPC
jgi:hypothetical protein